MNWVEMLMSLASGAMFRASFRKVGEVGDLDGSG